MASLFDSLKVKVITIRNRIVMPPMQTNLATDEGSVTSRLIEHYTRRSKALGLVIVEHSYVPLEGKLSRKQLGIYDDRLVSRLRKLSSSVRANGALVAIQINHAGRTASSEITGMQPVAPSSDESTKELDADEIDALAEAFSSAAKRAVRAGFDGVELHGAHGFLLNQFYSPLTNNRRDKYGGSLQNRMRFPLEVVIRVKEQIDGRLLLYRIGSVDLDPAGIQIEDSKKFASKLEAAKVDIIDVSGGLSGDNPAQLKNLQGYFVPQAQEIRKVVDIPVIGVGGITEPEYANKLILEDRVDLVAVGRALLYDAEWVQKAAEKLGYKLVSGKTSG